MNVIKIKDKIKENDEDFNSLLKDKYAWWVHMRYIIPFSIMSTQQYISVEEDISELTEYKYWDSYNSEMSEFVDIKETDKINSIYSYLMANKIANDSEYTLDEIKKFRTWLATTLLEINSNYNILNEKIINTLEYYKAGMIDQTVKNLNNYILSKVNFVDQFSDCGCNNSNIYANLINTCDPVTIYKQMLYENMVENFSDINFWLNFKTEIWFFKKFKTFIDIIIKKDLIITNDSNNNDNYLYICGKANTTSNNNKIILENLSNALQFVISNNIEQHKNYIQDSFNQWAKNLYENMEW